MSNGGRGRCWLARWCCWLACAFTGHGTDYLMAVLSVNADPNDDEDYGIDTIELIARLVQHDLNDATPTMPSAASAATGG